jgi:hypothetical protein
MILKIRWQRAYEEKFTKKTMNLITNVRIVGGSKFPWAKMIKGSNTKL